MKSDMKAVVSNVFWKNPVAAVTLFIPLSPCWHRRRNI